MQTVSGLYDDYFIARSAVEELEAAGFPHADITIVSNDPAFEQEEYTAEGASAGAGLGAVVGGTGGLLAGLGIVAIPGLGPVVAAGWLATTLAGLAAGAVVGGAAGGLIGSLVGAGIDEKDAHHYAEGVRRGGTLVSVRVDESQAELARSILHRGGPSPDSGQSDETQQDLFGNQEETRRENRENRERLEQERERFINTRGL